MINILASGCFILLLIDGSTDISTSHMLIMYVRFLFDGAVSTRFLQIVYLPGGKAEDIFDTVLWMVAAL